VEDQGEGARARDGDRAGDVVEAVGAAQGDRIAPSPRVDRGRGGRGRAEDRDGVVPRARVQGQRPDIGVRTGKPGPGQGAHGHGIRVVPDIRLVVVVQRQGAGLAVDGERAGDVGQAVRPADIDGVESATRVDRGRGGRGRAQDVEDAAAGTG